MTLWHKVAVLATLQLAALAAMIADKQWTLETGTPVLLQTEAVDPRSLFMGDYARLAYPIGRLRLDGDGAIGGARDFKAHDTVWVALKNDPAGAQAVSVHHRREDVSAGLLPLKGEVTYISNMVWDPEERKTVQRPTMQVRYGIEQYYVQEGSGHQIERPRNGAKLTIRAAIDSRGKAGILAVLFDGQERYRERLF